MGEVGTSTHPRSCRGIGLWDRGGFRSVTGEASWGAAWGVGKRCSIAVSSGSGGSGLQAYPLQSSPALTAPAASITEAGKLKGLLLFLRLIRETRLIPGAARFDVCSRNAAGRWRCRVVDGWDTSVGGGLAGVAEIVSSMRSATNWRAPPKT